VGFHTGVAGTVEAVSKIDEIKFCLLCHTNQLERAGVPHHNL
jgi:AhpD family alkylhydroperoxidase